MSKHAVLLLVVLVFLAGCERSGDLRVQVVAAGPQGERGLSSLEVRLLPYDRDSIFDTLADRAPEPEPQIPEDLLALRDSVSEAQSEWRSAETEWNQVRSELQTLANEMQGMERSSDQYLEAFQRFEDLEAREEQSSRRKDSLFERFTELQNRYNVRQDSMEAVRTTWADRAFEDYNEIVDSLLEANGWQELADTTGSGGWARFQPPAGQWWLHTRYALPYEELYWNVPVEVSGGETDTVVLDTANAELRPLF